MSSKESVTLVVCGTIEHGASLATSADNLITHPWMLGEDGFVELYHIRAETYEAAMTIYYENQGWAPYQTLP